MTQDERGEVHYELVELPSEAEVKAWLDAGAPGYVPFRLMTRNELLAVYGMAIPRSENVK